MRSDGDASETHPSVDRSAGAVLVYDGGCGFCSTAVTLMSRALPAPPPAVPYQWADLPSLGLTEALASTRLWLITPQRRFGGHLAVSAMLRHQPDVIMRFLGWLIATPPYSPIAALAYLIIARNRHRLPGGTPTCAIRPQASGKSKWGFY